MRSWDVRAMIAIAAFRMKYSANILELLSRRMGLPTVAEEVEVHNQLRICKLNHRRSGNEQVRRRRTPNSSPGIPA